MVRWVPFVPAPLAGTVVIVEVCSSRRGWSLTPGTLPPGHGWPDSSTPGGLAVVAQDSYEGVITRVIRVGPAGEVPGASKLVQVRFVGPVERGGATTIWLHWRRPARPAACSRRWTRT